MPGLEYLGPAAAVEPDPNWLIATKLGDVEVLQADAHVGVVGMALRLRGHSAAPGFIAAPTTRRCGGTPGAGLHGRGPSLSA